MSKNAMFAGAALLLGGLSALASEVAQEAKIGRKEVLAGLPSSPGPHVKRIQALGDNEWFDQGSPGPDPKWGKALGRSYSPRMVYLPKQRAGFLAGQGVHGGMKKGGIYQDEVFAYDINAHRWICIYPGSDVTNLTLRLDRHGFEVNDKGEHVPVAILGHGHHLFTYDSDQNKLVIIPLGNTWWDKAFPRRKEWLDDRASAWLRNPRHPWLYDPATGRWEHRFVEGDGPGPRQYFSAVEYLPSKKRTFFLDRGCKVWLYDGVANAWTTGETPAKPLGGYDWNGCLDTRRERVFVGQSKDLLAYDARTGEWKMCAAPPAGAFFGNSTTNTMTYDAANDVVVLGMMHRGSGIARENQGKGRLYFYRPGSDTWEKRSTPLPSWSGVVNAFYDPDLNAHFFHVARDSMADGTIFVYRYRGSRKTEKERRQ
jgi:hypothetical protein